MAKFEKRGSGIKDADSMHNLDSDGKQLVAAENNDLRDNLNDTEVVLDVSEEELWQLYVNKFSNTSLTSDEYIDEINQLHTLFTFSGWVIGEIFLVIENKILKDKESIFYKEYKSFNDWFIHNSDRFHFSKSTAYNYINIRRQLTHEQIEKYGLSRAYELSRITDKRDLKRVEKQIDKDDPIDKIKDTIENTIKKRQEVNKKEKKSLTEKISEDVKLAIYQDKRNKNKIIVEGASPEEAEEVLNYLNNTYFSMKKYLYEKKKDLA